ncbi:hypothetical protein [Microbispora sp. NPDC049125]|uniref:hypothetical protein n=1 Tax=Microbispora sp. NPDC049125 TaxID=3154929 RepID=UPI0034656A21
MGARGDGLAWTLAAWERGLHESPVDRAVTLLTAVTGISREEAESADVGSRDSVLSATLTRMADGVVRSCVRCAGCGERLDVPLDPAALPRTAWRTPGETLHVEVAGTRVAFRLPDSRDLRMLGMLGGNDAAAGRMLLLSRCLGVEHIEDIDGTAGVAGIGAVTQTEGITEEVAAAVEAAMEDAAPSGAPTVRIGCPACPATTVAALDVSALLWAEVSASALALLRDVHALARAYGWTEPEVLALSPARRAAYLEMAYPEMAYG